MKNAINWFEIPVIDFDRAKKFYSTLFGAEIIEYPVPDTKYGVLPYEESSGGIGGAIVESKGEHTPSQNGALLYLNGGDDLSVPLSRVENAGGKIVLAKAAIGENGFMAHILDTEGNKLALHSMK